MKNIIEENYKSIVKRGLINENTTIFDFIDKIQEELNEFKESVNVFIKNPHRINAEQDMHEELSDIILTSLNTAKHYKIDIEHELKRKITINKNR